MLGYGEYKLQRLREVLAREKDINLAVEEFRKMEKDPIKEVEHKLVESEEEMMKLLNQGWEIERELNGGGKFTMKRRA